MTSPGPLRTDEAQEALTGDANADTSRTPARDPLDCGSSRARGVPPAGLEPNEQQRFDRLETVWNEARIGIRDSGTSQREDDFEGVTEPSRPPRTPPTPEEVDAIRTAKASGECVRSIAERFNKHRSTIWRYMKDIR